MFTHEVMVRVASLYGEYGLAYPDVVRADLAGVVQVALEPTHISVWLGQ
jgi:hypothetical protein